MFGMEFEMNQIYAMGAMTLILILIILIYIYRKIFVPVESEEVERLKTLNEKNAASHKIAIALKDSLIESLKKQNSEVKSQINSSLSDKLSEIESAKKKEIDELVNQRDGVSLQIKSALQDKENLNLQISQYESKLKLKNEEITQINSQLKNMSKDISKLNNYCDKLKTYQFYSQRIILDKSLENNLKNEMDKVNSDLDLNQTLINNLKTENKQLLENVQNTKDENNTIKDKLSKLEIEISYLKRDNTNKDEQIKIQEGSNEEYKSKILKLTKDIDSLKDKSADESRKIMANKEEQIKNLEATIEDQKTKNIKLTKEFDSLKDKIADESRKSIANKEEQIKNLEAIIEDQKTKILKLTKELDISKNKIKEEIASKEGEIKKLDINIDEQKSKNIKLTKEIEELKGKIAEDSATTETTIDEQKSKIITLTKELDDLYGKMAQDTKKFDQIKNYEETIYELKTKYTTVTKELDAMKTKVFEDTRKNNSASREARTTIATKDETITSLNNNINDLKSKIKSLNKEIVILKEKAELKSPVKVDIKETVSSRNKMISNADLNTKLADLQLVNDKLSFKIKVTNESMEYFKKKYDVKNIEYINSYIEYNNKNENINLSYNNLHQKYEYVNIYQASKENIEQQKLQQKYDNRLLNLNNKVKQLTDLIKTSNNKVEKSFIQEKEQEINRLKENFNSQSSHLSQVESEKFNYEQSYLTLKSDLQTKEHLILEMESTIKDLHMKLHYIDINDQTRSIEIDQNVSYLQCEVDSLQQQLDNSHREFEALQDAHISLQSSCRLNTETISTLKDSIRKKEALLKQYEEKMFEENRNHSEQMKRELTKLSKHTGNKDVQLQQLHTELTSAKYEAENCRSRMESVELELKSKMHTIFEKDEIIAKLKEDQMQSNKDSARHHNDDNHQVSSLKRELESIKLQYYTLKRKYYTGLNTNNTTTNFEHDLTELYLTKNVADSNNEDDLKNEVEEAELLRKNSRKSHISDIHSERPQYEQVTKEDHPVPNDSLFNNDTDEIPKIAYYSENNINMSKIISAYDKEITYLKINLENEIIDKKKWHNEFKNVEEKLKISEISIQNLQRVVKNFEKLNQMIEQMESENKSLRSQIQIYKNGNSNQSEPQTEQKPDNTISENEILKLQMKLAAVQQFWSDNKAELVTLKRKNRDLVDENKRIVSTLEETSRLYDESKYKSAGGVGFEVKLESLVKKYELQLKMKDETIHKLYKVISDLKSIIFNLNQGSDPYASSTTPFSIPGSPIKSFSSSLSNKYVRFQNDTNNESISNLNNLVPNVQIESPIKDYNIMMSTNDQTGSAGADYIKSSTESRNYHQKNVSIEPLSEKMTFKSIFSHTNPQNKLQNTMVKSDFDLSYENPTVKSMTKENYNSNQSDKLENEVYNYSYNQEKYANNEYTNQNENTIVSKVKGYYSKKSDSLKQSINKYQSERRYKHNYNSEYHSEGNKMLGTSQQVSNYMKNNFNSNCSQDNNMLHIDNFTLSKSMSYHEEDSKTRYLRKPKGTKGNRVSSPLWRY